MEAPSTPLQSPPRKPKRGYTRHGTTALRKALVRSRKLDKRTRAGKALVEWRASLVRDLGGEAALSTQRLALVELAVRTLLILDHIDSWLLAQPSLVNARARAVLPVVRERT